MDKVVKIMRVIEERRALNERLADMWLDEIGRKPAGSEEVAKLITLYTNCKDLQYEYEQLQAKIADAMMEE